MKILGLIGGTGWVSTIDYYREICLGFNEKFGGINYGKCIIYSLNFEEIVTNNNKGDYDANYQLIQDAAINLKFAGANAFILCANTMHMFADRLEQTVKLPVIHIAKATGNEINKQGLKKVGLLGTKATMELAFYKDILHNQGVESITPDEADRNYINEKIFSELGKNILKEDTKTAFLTIINKLLNKGAEGIILGCTEIPLLIKQSDCACPIFDTTIIHSKAAVELALS